MFSYKYISIIGVSVMLMSCGEVSPKIATTGSSYFGFVSYFTQPLNATIIASGEAADAAAGKAQAKASGEQPLSLTRLDIKAAITATDSSPDIFNTDYCNYFAENFAGRLPTEYLGTPDIDNSHDNSHDVISYTAALVLEKSYLEVMKNYCYTNETFYLTDTRITEETDKTFGKVRWFRNSATQLGGARTFDYLISQSRANDSTIKILSTFKESGTVLNHRLYGQLRFSQYSNGTRETQLNRYFVHDDTKPNAIPNSFRIESYSLKSAQTQTTDFTVNHVAAYALDYVNNSDTLSKNLLVIHKSAIIVVENSGSKLISAEYCSYPTSSLSNTEMIYACSNTAHSDKKRSAITPPVYFSIDGGIIKPIKGKYSRADQGTIDQINIAVDAIQTEGELTADLEKISPPFKLKANMDFNSLFDTSSAKSHLNF